LVWCFLARCSGLGGESVFLGVVIKVRKKSSKNGLGGGGGVLSDNRRNFVKICGIVLLKK